MSELYSYNDWRDYEALKHHGILGQKWYVKNGPPYPLDAEDHNASEKKAGWRKSLQGTADQVVGKIGMNSHGQTLAFVSGPRGKGESDSEYNLRKRDIDYYQKEYNNSKDRYVRGVESKYGEGSGKTRLQKDMSKVVDSAFFSPSSFSNLKGQPRLLSKAMKDLRMNPEIRFSADRTQDKYDNQRKLYWQIFEEQGKLYRSGTLKTWDQDEFDNYMESNPNSKAYKLTVKYAKADADYMNDLRSEANDLLGEHASDKVNYSISSKDAGKMTKDHAIINATRQIHESRSPYYIYSDYLDNKKHK